MCHLVCKNGVHSSSIDLPTLPLVWQSREWATSTGTALLISLAEHQHRSVCHLVPQKRRLFQQYQPTPSSLAWQIAGVGDFNGDGFADLVLENTSTGQRAIWILKDGVYSSTINLPTTTVAWHIADH